MTTTPTILRTSRSKTNPPPKPQPWYDYLTLDVLNAVLFRTLFHPFIACLLPLCLRALAAPYDSTSFIVTATFASAVCLYHIFTSIDARIAHGAPRPLNWAKEVVVITGGAQGLGACIAEIYSIRSVSVAVIDVAVPKEIDGREREGIRYFRCDVADADDVDETWKRITQSLGTPTILINNAAIVKSSSVVASKIEDIDSVFRVNTLAHFQLTQLFLTRLLKRTTTTTSGGTIVTVSSVLGHLGAANLSAYTASKAALFAYHTSLSAELAETAPRIKTILVASGQLDTALFGKAKVRGWLQNFVGPVVGVGELAGRIVDMVDKGQGGEVRMPVYATWISVLGVLSPGVRRVLRRWSGVDVSLGGVEGEVSGGLGAGEEGGDADSDEEERSGESGGGGGTSDSDAS